MCRHTRIDEMEERMEIRKTTEERKRKMEQKNQFRLPDRRQLIHDLTLQKHSGLSPPEEKILASEEGLESSDAYSEE